MVWFTPVIPALRRLKEEDWINEFDVQLDYLLRPRVKKIPLFFWHKNRKSEKVEICPENPVLLFCLYIFKFKVAQPVAQVGLQSSCLRVSKCWDYWHVPPSLAFSSSFPSPLLCPSSSVCSTVV
jgi:hypothetical protein